MSRDCTSFVKANIPFIFHIADFYRSGSITFRPIPFISLILFIFYFFVYILLFYTLCNHSPLTTKSWTLFLRKSRFQWGPHCSIFSILCSALWITLSLFSTICPSIYSVQLHFWYLQTFHYSCTQLVCCLFILMLVFSVYRI